MPSRSRLMLVHRDGSLYHLDCEERIQQVYSSQYHGPAMGANSTTSAWHCQLDLHFLMVNGLDFDCLWKLDCCTEGKSHWLHSHSMALSCRLSTLCSWYTVISVGRSEWSLLAEVNTLLMITLDMYGSTFYQHFCEWKINWLQTQQLWPAVQWISLICLCWMFRRLGRRHCWQKVYIWLCVYAWWLAGRAVSNLVLLCPQLKQGMCSSP